MGLFVLWLFFLAMYWLGWTFGYHAGLREALRRWKQRDDYLEEINRVFDEDKPDG